MNSGKDDKLDQIFSESMIDLTYVQVTLSKTFENNAQSSNDVS